VTCFEDLVRGDLDSWQQVGTLVGLGAEEAFSLFSAEHQRERITERQLRYGRTMRMLLPFVATPDIRAVRGWTGAALQGGSKFVPSWAPAQVERLATYYAAGNSKLEKVFGLRLQALRYPGMA